MPVTTNYDVAINSGILVNQPSRVTPHPPEPKRFQNIDGAWYTFPKTKGWKFELEWGDSSLADPDAAAELLALQAAIAPNITTTLGFIWYDGVQHEWTVMWPEAVSAAFRWASNTEKFTIMLYETTTTEAD